MNSAEVLIKFKGDTKDAEKSTNQMTASIGQLTKSFTIANLAARAITKTLGVMSASMDSAIRRVDIMNNFPRVMSNLGVSAEDSTEVIKDLSKQLQGLPTTMDNAAAAVQRFTSKNGDVKQSEKLFLAVNNAILAGGSSTEIQSSALEQLSQAYAKGKPDMMEWRTLMTAMPAQLKQVANAMGYVDAAMLGEAVRADGGEKEFARMMDTMMRMNTEGVNGFKSFDEQARNATGGIQTSITNMKTAFVRGVADMINKVNGALEPFGGLNGVLKSIGKFGEQTFKKIGDILTWVIPKVIELGNWLVKNKNWIIALIVPIATFVATFKTIKSVITIIKGVKTAFALLNATMLANPITLIIAAITALVAGFIYLWNNCEAFKNFWIGLWEGIKNVFNVVIEAIKTGIQAFINFILGIPQTIMNIVNSIISFIANLPYYIGFAIGYIIGLLVKFVTQDIPNFVNGVITWITQLPAKVSEIIENIVSLIIGLPGRIIAIAVWLAQRIGLWWEKTKSKIQYKVGEIKENIINTIKELPGNMLNVGKNIVEGLWQGIKNAKDWIVKKIKNFAKGILDGMKKALGIHSPSKEFAILGKFSVLGYTEALDDMTNDVQKQINSTFALSPSIQSAGLHYSPNVNVYNNVDVSTDPLGQTVSQIKTFSGGARNDYNYGMGAI